MDPLEFGGLIPGFTMRAFQVSSNKLYASD